MSGPSFSAADVARLARIDLNAAELESLQNDLDRILDFVGQIEPLELDDVTPFFGIVPPQNTTRPDQVMAGSSRDQALSNAPRTAGPYFVVPPVRWSAAQSPGDASPPDLNS